jgi:aspartyl-tRNA(Asn)/glutamyl-tRNA(Gln) amidotransferase subunit A
VFSVRLGFFVLDFFFSLFFQLDVTSTYDPKDPTAATPEIRQNAHLALPPSFGESLQGLRIGIPHVRPIVSFRPHISFRLDLFQEYFPSELDEGIIQSFRSIISTLRDNGASIIPVSLPSTPYALSAYYVIASAEASSNMARYDGVKYGAVVFAMLF